MSFALHARSYVKKMISFVIFEKLPLAILCIIMGVYHQATDISDTCHINNMFNLTPDRYLYYMGLSRVLGSVIILVICACLLIDLIGTSILKLLWLILLMMFGTELVLLIFGAPILFQNDIIKLAGSCYYVMYTICLWFLSVFNFCSLIKMGRVSYYVHSYIVDELQSLLQHKNATEEADQRIII